MAGPEPMAELLLEILSEEIPARMQARAADDLKEKLLEIVDTAGFAKDVGTDDVETHVTPRRLCAVVRNLPTRQPDAVRERKGPRLDAPDKAVQGFLRASGLETTDQAEVRETEKGRFYFAVSTVAGAETIDLLADRLPELIHGFSWPKSMRWGAHGTRWVRPIQSILCLFDGAVVPFRVAGVEAGDTTRGHRFMAPEPIRVTGFEEYRERLRRARVMLDRKERRAVIFAAARKAADAENLVLRDDPGLLDEVAGLVEWPVVMVGAIDPAFLEVPVEVLISAMRGHQKYFPLVHPDGALAPRFVLVANLVAADGGRAILAGNERVLRARLADAKFFWDQDRKQTLASRLPALDAIVYHADLGSLGAKAARLESLAAALAGYIPDAAVDHCRRAAQLAKSDLTTDMVGEFPELQGLMGRYYALGDGEDPAVAQAIGDHYAPRGPADTSPSAPAAVAVALADKIDALVGFFAIDEKPTGSKDPFALRRAALGVIRLILENRLRLPLRTIFAAALAAYPTALQIDPETRAAALLEFFADRLTVHLRAQGVRHDHIAAIFALSGEDDLVRLLARVAALATFLDGDDGANLLVAYRRAANILRIEEKKDGRTYDGAAEAALFALDDEGVLDRALAEVAGAARAAVEGDDFAGAMAAMAGLRAPIDGFFDRVTVNAEDVALRANRLRLLARIRATLHQVADFSKIEG